MYSGKNVLVAGGTGTIGIPLVKMLMEKGANVSVVSLDSKEYAKKVFNNEIPFERYDLTDVGNCLKVTKNQDYVFNLIDLIIITYN